MSTARNTPAQNPRGLTLSNTFPFVSVCIVILMSGFRRLYHTLRNGRLAAFPAVWTSTMFAGSMAGFALEIAKAPASVRGRNHGTQISILWARAGRPLRTGSSILALPNRGDDEQTVSMRRDEMRVESVVLEGSFVRLEPLSLAHHSGLSEVGLDEELWQWIPTPIRTGAAMAAYIETALKEQANG